MRLLLLSDTHGELSVINELARQVRAEAVVNAGDFGFYDQASAGRLSARELRLRVFHSDLPAEIKRQARRLDRPALKALVEERAPLNELPAFLSGDASFAVPVYAVWGNHKDRAVVEAFLAGSVGVPNLHLLAPGRPLRVGPYRLFGLGGNLLPGGKLLDRPLAGGGGKDWATLAEIGALLEASEAEPPAAGEVRVLVAHVSPGKEPLIARLGARLQAHFLVSGHMGSPYCAIWNEFTIRTPGDARAWFDRDVERVREAWEQAAPGDRPDRRMMERGLELLDEVPGEPVKRGRGPDAHDGHAVLQLVDGRVTLETHSAGRPVE